MESSSLYRIFRAAGIALSIVLFLAGVAGVVYLIVANWPG